MVKFLLHFLFLFAAVALVARRGEKYFWWALGVFCGGIAANALYGVLQLGVAQTTGGNLDATVLSPITGGASQINIYGAVEGASVYRPNALTGDPNHLAIELLVPLLVLLPIYLRLERGNRFRVPLMRDPDGPARDRARDVLAQRPARALLRPARARRPLPPPLPAPRFLRAARRPCS